MLLSEFRTHIKTRLGYPAINVELDSTQMNIYIEDAVKKFIETHYDGLDEGYIFLDTVIDQTAYTLSSRIHSVLKVFGASNNLLQDDPLLINPYIFNGTMTVSGDVLDLEMFKQSMSMFEGILGNVRRFEYNSTTNILTIFETPVAVEKLMLHVQISPEDIKLIYENLWVKKYATSLCKYAWGQNLSKYTGATLPGGVSLNYDRILDEAKEELVKLEEELNQKYQEPIDFYFG